MSPGVFVILLIIAVPTYFICLWRLKKLQAGTSKNRKWLALIPTLILSPAIYVGLFVIWMFSIHYYPTKDFDQTEWTSNTTERYTMSEDIIESRMLIGKTHTEVMDILGTDYSYRSESRITYELGFVPGLFNIDPDYLEIKLEDGIVKSVAQYQG